jgi:replicative DNA helicase
VDKHRLREVIAASAELMGNAFDPGADADTVVASAQEKMFAISASHAGRDYHKMGDLLPETFQQIERMQKGETLGMSTGLSDLDAATSGLYAGDLVIIAGRTSMGKTAFATGICLHAAIKAKKKCLIISCEMSKDQIMFRALCHEARINMHVLRAGHLPMRDYPKLSIAATPLMEAPVWIADQPGATPVDVAAKARRLKRQNGLDLIVIDYLQLMRLGKRVDSRQQEVAEISRSLKEIAKALEVPVIALAQLSRATDLRTGAHRPQLSDLRESGAIEQDADVVLFLYRDIVYNQESEERDTAEVIIAKQRNGPISTVKVHIDQQCMRFDDLAKDDNGDWGRRAQDFVKRSEIKKIS